MTILTASTLRELGSVPFSGQTAGGVLGPRGRYCESPVSWVDPADVLRSQWEPHLETLRRWHAGAAELIDEGFDAPTRDVITVAMNLAESLIVDDCPPPTQITPTVEGGIAFERRQGAFLSVVEINPDGDAEILVFEDSRLVERLPLA